MRFFSTLALVSVTCVCLASTETSSPGDAVDAPATLDAEIHAVENGLLPAIIVSGNAHPARTLSEEMRRRHIPAVSIAVIHNGAIRWSHAWGTVNPKGGGPAPTPDTLFQAASISKSVSAMGALHLVQEGKLSLDAPVQTELKSWTLPQNNFTAQHPVTLRELLTNTAGMNVSGFEGYASTEPVPTLHQVLDGVKPANNEPIRVVAVPGQAWSYSGGGFTVAQQMMIDASGEPFPQIMQSAVLGPIGMRHSTFEQPLAPGRMKQVALPANDQGKLIPGGPHVYPEMAAAGLWTTASDLALWVIEMQRSLQGKANHVLSPEMTRLMLTAVKNNYGMAVMMGKEAGLLSFSHTGANEGYRNVYIGYETGDGVVILTSGDDGSALYPWILRSIATVYKWPAWKAKERTPISLPESALSAFTGKFTAPQLGQIEINLVNGHLQAKLPHFGSSALFASSRDTFFADESGAEIHFDSSVSGKILIDEESIPFSRAK
jgi:CubicO group peptidase (beta-lactamase class C family)